MKSLWSGSISFGLVNIPVRLYSASPEEELDLDMLHAKDQSTIRYARICKAEEKEIPYEEIVRGYKYSDKYVILEESDFEKVNPKKTGTIDIHTFVKAEDIDSILYEKPYYVEPVKQGAKAYALLRKALEETKTVGIATFVLRNREHLAALKAHERALILNQMRFAHDLPPVKLDIPQRQDVSSQELAMANKLIRDLTGEFDITEYHDTYIEELMELIEKKAHGKKITPKTAPAKPTKVTDLMALLKKSLQRHR